MKHALHELMHQKVDVDASSTTYTGVLKEITDREVTLWTEDGWLSVPHDRIKGVRIARPSGKELLK